MTNFGWVCSLCGRSNSPAVMSCACTPAKQATSTPAAPVRHYYIGYEPGSGGAMCSCGDPHCTM